MDASQLTKRLRKQAADFLLCDHPNNVWFHRDALNVIADLESGPATPGVIAHAQGASELYNRILERQ